MKLSFGWDLAGYGNSGSGLCRAAREGDTITATVLRAPFICRPKLGIHSVIEDIVEIEAAMLRRFAKAGPTFIDVPIDLQSLLRIADYRTDERAANYWQIVKRPVDYAFQALEPLGSNLGYAVARVAHLLGSINRCASGPVLGESVFETYPAASLQLARATNNWTEEAYKGGKIEFVDGRWQPERSQQKLKQKTHNKRVALAELANCFRLRAEEGFQLDDDAFDAIVCAVTGCIPECEVRGATLRRAIQQRLMAMGVPDATAREAEPPKGYVVINDVPGTINIEVREVECEHPNALFAAIGPQPGETADADSNDSRCVTPAPRGSA